MTGKFAGIFEKGERYYIGYCAEIAGGEWAR